MSAFDPSGRPTPITTGLITNARGTWVAVMAIGVPSAAVTAILTKDVVDKVGKNLHAAISVDRRERTVPTHDTLGRAVPITTSRRQSRGDVPVLTIGGPEGAAVITGLIQERLTVNMRAVLADVDQLRREGL